ncbi:hypothetical protein GCM10011579_032540 [Streptomyces albiflavescens]|uniref:Uncharacterized protein n=1 Tax=Streptomyces albiflavescens TaxID=1623582 RepID=A0A917Y2M0_9ACTN|nr:hypothetical protein GCM10011579_032540 [Streptomyces albiflavescens]
MTKGENADNRHEHPAPRQHITAGQHTGTNEEAPTPHATAPTPGTRSTHPSRPAHHLPDPPGHRPAPHPPPGISSAPTHDSIEAEAAHTRHWAHPPPPPGTPPADNRPHQQPARTTVTAHTASTHQTTPATAPGPHGAPAGAPAGTSGWPPPHVPAGRIPPPIRLERHRLHNRDGVRDTYQSMADVLAQLT